MYKDIVRKHISTLTIFNGSSIRTDCPVCNNRNTFSITDFRDSIKFNCFHADCTAQGTLGKGLNEDSFKERKAVTEKHGNSPCIALSQHWRKTDLPRSALIYLKRVNCYHQWRNNTADIRYDFKEDRVVFCLTEQNTGKVIDAAGRALNSDTVPKWYRYGSSRTPFICGNGKVAAVVEDCASAVRISHLCSGVALLGTSLFPEALKELEKYDKVIVALDHDATLKALGMVQEIQSYVPDVEMAMLDVDLKTMVSDTEVKDVLKI